MKTDLVLLAIGFAGGFVTAFGAQKLWALIKGTAQKDVNAAKQNIGQKIEDLGGKVKG